MKTNVLSTRRTALTEVLALQPCQEKKLLERPCPPDYHRELVLRDGTKYLVRPITCKDKKELLKFHTRLSPETRFLRYHYSKGELTDEDLQKFCDLDYKDAMGLVVETTDENNPEIIAVGRYFRIPPDHTAEVAMVVQDSEQGKGIGTQLLKHLAILAHKNDIHHFVGEVLRQNGKMLAVFNRCDPGLEFEVDSPGTCTINTSVDQIINEN
jgi:RimJ/RimL family protein N-acetyltransferase